MMTWRHMVDRRPSLLCVRSLLRHTASRSLHVKMLRRFRPNQVKHKLTSFSSKRRPSKYTTPLNDALDDTGILEPLLSRDLDADTTVLPLRRNADDYLRCYWTFVHPLFPVLHKPSFNARYETLWEAQSQEGDGGASVTFIPTLNLVFALGCQFSDLVSAERKAKAASSFYSMSRSVLHYDVLGSTKVTVVQWLLLSVIYLQSTSLATNCWTSLGLAVRLAQNIGIHLEPLDREKESQVDREMRRRIWHTCVMLDR